MREWRVVALALDGVVVFDISCIVQAFRRGPTPDGAPAGFTMETCGARVGRVRTPDGFDLVVAHGLDALDTADLIVVPGRYPPDAATPPKVLDSLVAAHERGTTLMSICIGAFVLGQAGLLDDRPVTTHWAFADDLARRFPRARVQPGKLYVDDGDLLTSAGFAAGLDLCIHVVRRRCGTAAARDLACWNVLAPHRQGGQAQFIPPPRTNVDDGDLGPTLDWAVQHLHEPLTVEQLATHAHLSTRTLRRRFEQRLGTSPKRWLLDQRVTRARTLLETTTAGIEQVADEAGFATAAAMRTHLHRHVASTPTAYRQRFA
jgi:transcriptional regulator GlxA family with amidase domain